MDQDISNSLTTGDENKKDAEVAAILMHLAFGDFSHHLFGTVNEVKILKYLEKMWIQNNNRMSSRYSYLFKENGQAEGLISCCRGDLVNKMFLPTLQEIIKVDPGIITYLLFRPHFLHVFLNSPEALNDEFYVFMLAVLPEHQNKGIGTKLLKFAEKQAREQNFKKLSLVVKIQNIHAIRLYERFGFKKVTTYDRHPMNVHRMVKELGK